MVIAGAAAMVLYLAVALLLLARLNRRAPAALSRRTALLAAGLVAVALHGVVLFSGLRGPTGFDLSFFTMLSAVSWLVALMLLVAALRRPLENLAILVLPLAALALGLRLASDRHHYLPAGLPPGLEAHILVSVLAYSLLSLAVVQALLLAVQERHLHRGHAAGFVRMLPPLETMERLLFRMIGLGFAVLSLALVLGALYVEDLFAQHLVHKTVLSVAAWVLFGLLLAGRWRFGWRGRTAIRWTISAFVLLMLAYFGSKLVLELILGI